MTSLATVIIMILQVLPWGELFKLALELIGKQQKRIDKKEVTTTQARDENIEIMHAMTASSPGVDKGVLYLIHQLAYMQFVQWNFPEKFANWEDNLEAWFKKAGSVPYPNPAAHRVYANMFDQKVNNLYTSRPDVIKNDEEPEEKVDSKKAFFDGFSTPAKNEDDME